MKLYRLDIKNRLNAPHKNENLRKKRVMAQVSETVSEEDRKRHLQSEYEEIVGEYDKGKYPSYLWEFWKWLFQLLHDSIDLNNLSKEKSHLSLPSHFYMKIKFNKFNS